jgi:hypothetical protein
VRSWLVGPPGASFSVTDGSNRSRGALRAWRALRRHGRDVSRHAGHPPTPCPPTQRKHGLWKAPRLMETADQTGAARVATLRCPQPPRPPVRRSHSRSETGSRPPAAPALHRPPSPVTAPPTAPTTRSYTLWEGKRAQLNTKGGSTPRRPLQPTTSLRPSLRSDEWSPSSEQVVAFAGIRTYGLESLSVA